MLSLVFKVKFTESKPVEGVVELLKIAAMASVPRCPGAHIKLGLKPLLKDSYIMGNRYEGRTNPQKSEA